MHTSFIGFFNYLLFRACLIAAVTAHATAVRASRVWKQILGQTIWQRSRGKNELGYVAAAKHVANGGAGVWTT